MEGLKDTEKGCVGRGLKEAGFEWGPKRREASRGREPWMEVNTCSLASE